MGFLSSLFGKKTKNKEKNSHAINNMVPQVTSQAVSMAKEHDDVVDGLIFSATCQVSTPLSVLLKHGEIYRGDGAPPIYGQGGRDGIWTMNVRSEYRYEDCRTSASDAGSVSSGDYIKFAIGLRTIFEGQLPIMEKMNKIIEYGESLDDEIKYISKNVIINRGSIKINIDANLADVMEKYVSDSERKMWYFNTPNHLDMINGINKKTATCLEKNGLNTMQKISNVGVSELVALEGIGKVSAQKIVNDCLSIKNLLAS